MFATMVLFLTLMLVPCAKVCERESTCFQVVDPRTGQDRAGQGTDSDREQVSKAKSHACKSVLLSKFLFEVKLLYDR